MATKTTREVVEGQRRVVRDAELAYERAKALYEEEPTRAHKENLRECKSDLTFTTNHLKRFESQLAEEAATR